jgi:two-component system response regulator
MAGRPAPSPVHILLVEDDPGDALMITEALRQAKAPGELHRVADGDEALAFLGRRDAFAQAPRPDLILLDLNLPRRGGLEILAELKADPRLRLIPVIVLSSSRAPEDIQRSYELHASAYIVKPADYDGMADVIRQVDAFVGIIQLPR